MELVFASGNLHKIREINNILGDSFTLRGISELNIYEDIPETGTTLEANALQKAHFIYDRYGLNVFADDTGLEVDALGGLPGVETARFAGEDKNSEANIDKLLMLLEGETNRSARFRTVIALVLDGSEYLFEGTVEGTIPTSRRGTDGFGYDAVFQPIDGDKTFAEMSLEGKNLISHRARAFAKLKEFLHSANR